MAQLSDRENGGEELLVKGPYDRAVAFSTGSIFFATTSLALFVSAAALKLSGKELAPELATAGGFILLPALLCFILASYFRCQAKYALGTEQESVSKAQSYMNRLAEQAAKTKNSI